MPVISNTNPNTLNSIDVARTGEAASNQHRNKYESFRSPSIPQDNKPRYMQV